MERYGSIESVLRAEIVEHQQANDALQRALDAEREKVKAEQEQWEIQAREGGRLKDQLTQLQAQADHTRIERNRLWGELADLQAQLRQVEGELAAMKGATNASS